MDSMGWTDHLATLRVVGILLLPLTCVGARIIHVQGRHTKYIAGFTSHLWPQVHHVVVERLLLRVPLPLKSQMSGMYSILKTRVHKSNLYSGVSMTDNTNDLAWTAATAAADISMHLQSSV